MLHKFIGFCELSMHPVRLAFTLGIDKHPALAEA